MRLHFYGTKGYVEASSHSHAGHSAFTIEADGFRLLCDFGENRKGLLGEIRPEAIFVSHAHPDHSWGLTEGTDTPVYGSAITHDLTAAMPLTDRIVLEPGRPVPVGPFRLTAFPVVHSVRCPGVAARIEVAGRVVVYSGDIVAFDTPGEALADAFLYVGDGSSLTTSLVRRQPNGTLVGHTTVRAQLGWLAKAGVPRALFAHFGDGPIGLGDDALDDAVAALAAERAPGCEVIAARDGLSLDF
ncbi:MAG: MBL fold metallo-hydrolase [Acidobacteriota bacterium]